MYPLSDIRIDIEHRSDGIDLARAAGEVDALGAPVLRDFLEDRIGTEHDFVLDLSDVSFLGSAGLMVLLEATEHAARHHVRWALVGNNRCVARPLQVTGLAEQLPLQPTVPAAIQTLATAVAV